MLASSRDRECPFNYLKGRLWSYKEFEEQLIRMEDENGMKETGELSLNLPWDKYH
jgi:hypothetical protein